MAVTSISSNGSTTRTREKQPSNDERMSRWIRPCSAASVPRPTSMTQGSQRLIVSEVSSPEVMTVLQMGTISLGSHLRNGNGKVRALRAEEETCEWCRKPLGARNVSGRKRVYCSQSCRQRAYQARKRSHELGLKDGEVVVSSVIVARMNKRLKAIEAALLEVERAELDKTDDRVYKLCQAAKRLRRLTIGSATH